MSLSLVIPVSGLAWTTSLPTGLHDRLNTMYRIIGGGCYLVTHAPLTGQFDMWVDDDGLATQAPNAPATLLAQRFGHTQRTYHGKAIITGPETPAGFADLTHEQVAHLRDLMGRS
ncbi:DUF3846 domain-containing protein [Actinomadura litoris]|uniref:DUF3846 domain-containing protein n=1 Tax=Actinomadura litoris TaxID=2678616 RepID=UPI001FA6F1A3|nr:DUF3846 domain-containing protein [Actinomadura litoris]